MSCAGPAPPKPLIRLRTYEGLDKSTDQRVLKVLDNSESPLKTFGVTEMFDTRLTANVMPIDFGIRTLANGDNPVLDIPHLAVNPAEE